MEFPPWAAPMRVVLMLASVGSFAGCAKDPYTDLSMPGADEAGRVAVLDARLRALLEIQPAGSEPIDLDSLGRSLAGSLPAGASTDDRIGALSRWFAGPSGVLAVLAPEDADLVPSLVWERKRGGCTGLAWAWMRAGSAMGIRLQPVLLPGHVVLRRPDGRLLEPLRHGMERSEAFYDSAFALAGRPGYSLARTNDSAISAALALHCGLLEWKAGNIATAASAFELSLALAPGLPEAEGNLGLVLEQLGEKERSTFHLRGALRGDPSNRRAAERLARLAPLVETPAP